MFAIPWRFVVGVILGAVIVKESRRTSEFYDTVKLKAAELIRRAKRKWSAAEPDKGPAASGACAE